MRFGFKSDQESKTVNKAMAAEYARIEEAEKVAERMMADERERKAERLAEFQKHAEWDAASYDIDVKRWADFLLFRIARAGNREAFCVRIDEGAVIALREGRAVNDRGYGSFWMNNYPDQDDPNKGVMFCVPRLRQRLPISGPVPKDEPAGFLMGLRMCAAEMRDCPNPATDDYVIFEKTAIHVPFGLGQSVYDKITVALKTDD